jgi:RNA polymerase sigma factor (sigma-70 family)
MRDSEVVAAIVAGDPAGLAEAYDRYAAPLYNYCRTLLREPADAADAVQDSFVIAASKLSGLRDPERLRSWLYAVARNECHRRLRSGGEQAPLEEATDVTDEAADVSADAERAEIRALVRDAMTGLAPAERAVLELDLQLRQQGLGGGEVASMLGVSRNHAHALLSRGRDHLETALGALVVARAGRRDCPVLDTLLKDWNGRLTVLLRKRVNQHIERCLVCSERRRQEMVPAKFLGVAPIAALPLVTVALPTGLRDQVLRIVTGNSPAAVAHRAAVARTRYTFGHHGFPKPLHPIKTPWWHPRPVHVSAAAGTAAAVTFAVTIVATPPHHDARPAAGGTVGVTGGTSPVAGIDPGSVGRTAAGRIDGTARPSVAAGSHPSASAMAEPTRTSTSTSTSASASASASMVATTAPATGTLSVSPATIDVVPPAVGSITLTASGGPVDWTIREPPGLTSKVIVSPMSGTLAAGATTTVSVTVSGPGKMHVHLVINPGGATVTVVVG